MNKQTNKQTPCWVCWSKLWEVPRVPRAQKPTWLQPHFERTACEISDPQSFYYFYRKLPQVNVNSVIPYMCIGATVCVIHVEVRGQLSTSVSLFLFLETNSLTRDPEFNCWAKADWSRSPSDLPVSTSPVPGLQAHVTRPGLFIWVLRTKSLLGWRALGKPSYLPSQSWLFLRKMEGFSGQYLEG